MISLYFVEVPIKAETDLLRNHLFYFYFRARLSQGRISDTPGVIPCICPVAWFKITKFMSIFVLFFEFLGILKVSLLLKNGGTNCTLKQSNMIIINFSKVQQLRNIVSKGEGILTKKWGQT